MCKNVGFVAFMAGDSMLKMHLLLQVGNDTLTPIHGRLMRGPYDKAQSRSIHEKRDFKRSNQGRPYPRVWHSGDTAEIRWTERTYGGP